MSCERISELLGPYMDGELEPGLSGEVESELDRCDRCRAELTLLTEMREAFRGPVLQAAQEARFDGLWERIEADIAGGREAAVAPAATLPTPDEAASPGVWDRLVGGLRRLFEEQPLIPIGAAATAALVVTLLVVGREDDKTPMPPQGPDIAKALKPSAPALPAPQVAPPEVATAEAEDDNNRAWVSSVEYTHGTVIIEQLPDPAEPTIVWHYDDAPEDDSQGG